MYQVLINGKLEAKFIISKRASNLVEALKDNQFIRYGKVKDTFSIKKLKSIYN